MVVLDRIAKRYGQRPSKLLGETDDATAFSIDLHAAKWGIFQDNVDMRNAQPKGMKRGR